MPKRKKFFNKENIKEYLSSATPRYLLMGIHIIIYIAILYRYGSNDTNTVKYMILTPMIISAFYIDYKKQIIPNRLTLTIFEIGLFFMFVQGMTSIVATRIVVTDMLLGMFTGGMVFILITVIGGMIFGKETMGFGDVKMMAALGLYFGFKGIIAIAILAFLIAALYSIVILTIQKIKHKDLIEYIAFGPFIVIATFVTIFVPIEVLMVLPFVVFSFGKYKL